MANISRNVSPSNVTSDRITAFFSDREDAFRAVSELKNSGFSSDQIGLAVSEESTGSMVANTGETMPAPGRDVGTRDKSFWQDIKDFFTGSDPDSRSDDYRDAIRNMGWGDDRAEYYQLGIQSGGAIVSVVGPRISEARIILERSGGDLRESGFDTSRFRTAGMRTSVPETTRGRAAENQDVERRIQLRGEMLTTYKERVRRGEVTLRKEVVTEHQTVDVPVTREELVIERTTPTGTTPTGEVGTDEEIRVPLEEERVRVQKQPVVNEEVRVGKRQVQRSERVSDDVKHEELKVDKEGDVDVQDEGTTKPRRKKPAA